MNKNIFTLNIPEKITSLSVAENTMYLQFYCEKKNRLNFVATNNPIDHHHPPPRLSTGHCPNIWPSEMQSQVDISLTRGFSDDVIDTRIKSYTGKNKRLCVW